MCRTEDVIQFSYLRIGCGMAFQPLFADFPWCLAVRQYPLTAPLLGLFLPYNLRVSLDHLRTLRRSAQPSPRCGALSLEDLLLNNVKRACSAAESVSLLHRSFSNILNQLAEWTRTTVSESSVITRNGYWFYDTIIPKFEEFLAEDFGTARTGGTVVRGSAYSGVGLVRSKGL
jgi:hypothetical protein